MEENANNLPQSHAKKIVNYYPRLLSYQTLRQNLKSGITKQEEKVVKQFECSCSKHKDLIFQAVAAPTENDIQINHCDMHAVTKGKKIINSEGKILIPGYQFYSTHSDWRVRVAVAIGLGKMEKAPELLEQLLQDKHYGVQLATIMVLGTRSFLETRSLIDNLKIKKRNPKKTEERIEEKNKDDVHQYRKRRAISFMIHRIRFGINPYKYFGLTLRKLQQNRMLATLYYKKERRNKISVPKNIFYNVLNEKNRKELFEHWSHQPSEIKKFPQMIRINRQIIRINEKRSSSDHKMKDKINFRTQLFWRDAVPVESIEKQQLVSGEVYWAMTDPSDPKSTRPVLILKTVSQARGKFLVAPLTSNVSSTSPGDMIVEIKGQKSKIQLNLRRTIHYSLLLNKHGNINEHELTAALAQLDKIKVYQKPKPHFFKHKKKLDKDQEEIYDIDEMPGQQIGKSPNLSSIKKNLPNRNLILIEEQEKAKKTKKKKPVKNKEIMVEPEKIVEGPKKSKKKKRVKNKDAMIATKKIEALKKTKAIEEGELVKNENAVTKPRKMARIFTLADYIKPEVFDQTSSAPKSM